MLPSWASVLMTILSDPDHVLQRKESLIWYGLSNFTLILLTHLETNEPPFLQRLRNQYGDTSGRLERPIARPRKPKDDTGDDDEPTYVDEESHDVISKEEYESLVRESNQKEDVHATGNSLTQDESAPKTHTDESTAEKEPPTSKQNLAEIGGQKKRKQAKVVGEDNAPESKEEPTEKATSQKPKQKKKKKIKLSFDEEE